MDKTELLAKAIESWRASKNYAQLRNNVLGLDNTFSVAEEAIAESRERNKHIERLERLVEEAWPHMMHKAYGSLIDADVVEASVWLDVARVELRKVNTSQVEQKSTTENDALALLREYYEDGIVFFDCENASEKADSWADRVRAVLGESDKPHSRFVASLERSLKDNADVWGELAQEDEPDETSLAYGMGYGEKDGEVG